MLKYTFIDSKKGDKSFERGDVTDFPRIESALSFTVTFVTSFYFCRPNAAIID